VDLVVCGKHAGMRAAEYARGAALPELPADALDFTLAQIDLLKNGDGSENVADIGHEMRSMMFDDVGVFRTQEGLTQAMEKLQELRQRFQHVRVSDPSSVQPELSAPGNWATCSTCPSPQPRPWRARNRAAATPARTSPSGTMPLAQTYAGLAGRRPGAPGYKPSGHQIRTQRTRVMIGGIPMTIKLRFFATIRRKIQAVLQTFELEVNPRIASWMPLKRCSATRWLPGLPSFPAPSGVGSDAMRINGRTPGVQGTDRGPRTTSHHRPIQGLKVKNDLIGTCTLLRTLPQGAALYY
jgi:hypothetical protein